MARRNINMDGLTTKDFVVNHRRGSEYKATIANNTAQTLTVTVTNEDIQGSSPTFAAPASGAFTLLTGAVGELNEPYEGWRLTLGLVGVAGDTIDIVEAG